MDMYKTLRVVVLAAAPVVYAGCENSNSEPVLPSPLEQTVHASAKVEEPDLSTPEAPIHALMSAYSEARHLDQRFLKPQFYHKLQNEAAIHPERFSRKRDVQSYEVLSTTYTNESEAVVEVASFIGGKKRIKKFPVKKQDGWRIDNW